MVYGGALAAGAFAGQYVVLFGETLEPGFESYLAIALAGTIGYTIGSIGGWAIGLYGGRPLVERHGRWLHVDAGTAGTGRALVRTLGRRRGLPRPHHAGRALVRRHPGRRLPYAARPVHAADAARLGDLVLRLRGHRLGARRQLGALPRRVLVRSTTRSIGTARRRCRLPGAARPRPGAAAARPSNPPRRNARSPAREGGTLRRRARAAGGRARAVRRVARRGNRTLDRGRRLRRVHPRTERDGVRGRGGRAPRCPRDGRRRQRHGRDRARARRDGHRAR